MKIFLYSSILLLTISCSNSDSNITIPSFAVKALKNSSLPQSVKPQSEITKNKSSIKRSAISSSKTSAIKIKPVSCSEEINSWGKAIEEKIEKNSPGKKLLVNFYAQAIFYDCNLRQQASTDFASAYNGTPELEEELEESLIEIYEAKNIGSIPEDKTRFISWTKSLNTDDVQGKLVNLYLQKDGIRTKTRIDLNKVNGLKVVKSIFLIDAIDANFEDGGSPKTYTRADFKEIASPNGEIVEHYVGGRHYSTEDKVITRVVASLKKDIGSSVFVVRCSKPASFNDSCAFSSSLLSYYYSSNGEEISRAEASKLSLTTDYNTLDSIFSDNFYTGEEDEYFEPIFKPILKP